MYKILEHCPTCSGELIVSELSCTQCDTRVSGRFNATRFARLSVESLHFLEIFIKNRGNVKEMERELDLSYWSIRNKLNHVIEELGFTEEPHPAGPQTDAEKATRQAILNQLDCGEISVHEAAGQLARLRQEQT